MINWQQNSLSSSDKSYFCSEQERGTQRATLCNTSRSVCSHTRWQFQWGGKWRPHRRNESRNRTVRSVVNKEGRRKWANSCTSMDSSHHRRQTWIFVNKSRDAPKSLLNQLLRQTFKSTYSLNPIATENWFYILFKFKVKSQLRTTILIYATTQSVMKLVHISTSHKSSNKRFFQSLQASSHVWSTLNDMALTCSQKFKKMHFKSIHHGDETRQQRRTKLTKTLMKTIKVPATAQATLKPTWATSVSIPITQENAEIYQQSSTRQTATASSTTHLPKNIIIRRQRDPPKRSCRNHMITKQ